MILGIDEVGRGPWAGPLVVGAVVLGDASIEGLTDSKKLSAKRRTELDALIRDQAAGWGLGWVHAHELDQLGLAESLRVATIRAVEAVKAPYHEIIIDGTINFLKETAKGAYVTTLAKADLLIPSVSAASIIAKVARDTYMTELATQYPGYAFERHVGYGTAAHRAALDSWGVTPEHRTSFAPIGRMLKIAPHRKAHIGSDGMTTKRIGDAAEERGARYLESEGHTILERNWKTKWCEIDIVTQHGDRVHFIEVKYRANASSGTSFDAITKKKQQQMRYAAEFYLSRHPHIKNAMLACVAVTPTTLEYLELK
jgi:ribonuclease HII